MVEEYEVRAVLYYTKEDIWVRVMADGAVRIGITDYAQKQLTEIEFVKLPNVGDDIKQMEPFGSIESVKAVLDLYSPISGKVREVNEKVINNPSIINWDPYGEGWLIVITHSKLKEELKNLLTAYTYKALIKRKSECTRKQKMIIYPLPKIH